MNSFLLLSVVAVVVQFVTERLKPLIPEKVRSTLTPFLALTLSIVAAFATHTGIFAAIGMEISPEWFDYIITGIAYSGGAVAFNELIKLISETRPGNKENEANGE